MDVKGAITPDDFLDNIQPDKENGFYFDEERADDACNWIEKWCVFTKGDWEDTNFKLHPWQRKYLRILFGFVKWIEVIPGEKRRVRQFRRGFVFLPKKNGKTMLCAAVGLYMLIGEGEKTPEVYSIAVDKTQSSIVFEMAERMINKNTAFEDVGVDVIRSPIKIRSPYNNGFFKPLSSRPDGIQGFSPSFVIVDEPHEFSKRSVYESIAAPRNFKSRKNGLVFIISTGGQDETGLTQDLVNQGLKIQKGEVPLKRFLPAIWMADKKEANWKDINLAKKLSPSYGFSLTDDDFEDDLEVALSSKFEEIDYKNKSLNLFESQEEAKWIPLNIWQESITELDFKTYNELFINNTVYMGLDYGPVNDFTSLAVITEIEGIFYIKHHTVATRGEIARQEEWNQPLRTWQKEGWLEEDDIETFEPSQLPVFLHAKTNLYKRVRSLGYDPSRIVEQMKTFDDKVKRFNCYDVSNTHNKFNEPMEFFMRALRAGRIRHLDDPCLYWQAENVSIKPHPRGLLMIDKSDYVNKIDTFSAIIMAFYCYVKREEIQVAHKRFVPIVGKKKSKF